MPTPTSPKKASRVSPVTPNPAEPSLGSLPSHLQLDVLAGLTQRDLARMALVSRAHHAQVKVLRGPHPSALTHRRPDVAPTGLPDYKTLFAERQGYAAQRDAQLRSDTPGSWLSCPEEGANLLNVSLTNKFNALWPERWVDSQSFVTPSVDDAHKAIVAFAQASRAWRQSDVGLASIAKALSVTSQGDEAVHYAQRLLDLWRASTHGKRALRRSLLDWVFSSLVAPAFFAEVAADKDAKSALHAPTIMLSGAMACSVAQVALARQLLSDQHEDIQALVLAATWRQLKDGATTHADATRTIALLESYMAEFSDYNARRDTEIKNRRDIMAAADAGDLRRFVSLHTDAGVPLPALRAFLAVKRLSACAVRLCRPPSPGKRVCSDYRAGRWTQQPR